MKLCQGAISDGRFVRWQREILKYESDAFCFENAASVLMAGLVKGMRSSPYPSQLHRTVVKDTELAGHKLQAGERVILGIKSMASEEQSDMNLLFGGNCYAKGTARPVHSCSGKNMALGVMVGLMAALARVGNVRKKGPMACEIRRFQ